jgi:WD40-like Beta Propeller Repeat
MHRTTVLLTALFALLAIAPGAEATLPGKNGRLLVVSPLFGSCDPNGCFTDALRAYSPRTGRRLAFGDACATATKCVITRASGAPDGSLVLSERSISREGMGRFQLVRRAADGSAPSVIADGLLDPAWSPDGRHIAARGLNGGLFVLGSDGTQRRLVTRRSAFDLDWSSRGLLAFERSGRIYVIRPDGTGFRRVARDAEGGPSWSPDGRRIAFACGLRPFRDRALRVRIDVCTVAAAGRDRRRVVRKAIDPAWSPDGRRLAFVRERRVGIARPDGTGQRILFKSPEFPKTLTWLPALG